MVRMIEKGNCRLVETQETALSILFVARSSCAGRFAPYLQEGYKQISGVALFGGHANAVQTT